MRTTPLSALLRALRPTQPEIGAWAGASRASVQAWQEGKWQPQPATSAKLLRAVRRHAKRLLSLAEAVEEREAAAARPRGGGGHGRPPGRRGSVPADVHRSAARRGRGTGAKR